MLTSLSAQAQYLACPACGSSVERATDKWECSNIDCPSSAGFPMLGNQPVFIDPANPLLDLNLLLASGGNSQVNRPNTKARRWIRTHILRGSAAAESRRRASIFIAQLRAVTTRPVVVIVGGGTIGLGSEVLLADPRLDVISFDIYRSDAIQFLADGHEIPLKDCIANGVWIQYVLEHVLDPPRVVAEVHRILRNDGVVYAETPFLQHVHEGPYDFTRFTHSGHRWLFRAFEEIDSGVAMGLGVQLMWSAEHLVRGITRSVRAGQAAKVLIAWPCHLLERLANRQFQYDSASSFYFLGKKSDVSMTAGDVIDYYKGVKRR